VVLAAGPSLDRSQVDEIRRRLDRPVRLAGG
jgi:hypothetical protein